MLVELQYLSRDNSKITTRKVEPYLINRTKSKWYLVAWCRERQAMRTFRFEMIKNAKTLDEPFEPRDIDLEPYLEDPRLPSGARDVKTADIRFSPMVSRWVQELQPHAVQLEDGALLCAIPYFSDRWLTDEVLKYQGEAILLGPAILRETIAEKALELLKNYR
jgi:predicted DNA-binding transcriptional regulator YafY